MSSSFGAVSAMFRLGWAPHVELRRSIDITTLLDRASVVPGPYQSIEPYSCSVVEAHKAAVQLVGRTRTRMPSAKGSICSKNKTLTFIRSTYTT